MNDNIVPLHRRRGKRPRYYILEGEEPRPVHDVMQWAELTRFGKMEWRVNFTDDGPFSVSTVFLGLDHNFFDDGPPLLFETMVFHSSDPFLDHSMRRTSTWDEAQAAHDLLVSQCRERANG